MSGAGSYWQAVTPPGERYRALAGPIDADVAIVGAGFTGLSLALHLSQEGSSVALLEAEQPGFGASGRNTGWWLPAWSNRMPSHAVAQWGNAHGLHAARKLADAGRLLRDIVLRHAIDCDLNPSGIILAASKSRTMERLAAGAAEWRSLGAAVDTLSAGALRARVATDCLVGGLLFRDGGALNPLAYARGMARAAAKAGAAIFGESRATAIEAVASGWRITTPGGTVTARRVVLATDTFAGGLWPALTGTFYRLPITMVASRPAPAFRACALPGGIAVSDMDSFDTFGLGFTPDARLVFSVLPSGRRDPAPAQAAALYWQKVMDYFPDAPAEIGWDHVWAGHIAMTPTMLPHMLELDTGLFAPVGYFGSGVAQATLMGSELARLLRTGRRDQFWLPITRPRGVPFRSLVETALRAAMPIAGRYLYRRH